jgi:hypothetical protein
MVVLEEITEVVAVLVEDITEVRQWVAVRRW